MVGSTCFAPPGIALTAQLILLAGRSCATHAVLRQPPSSSEVVPAADRQSKAAAKAAAKAAKAAAAAAAAADGCASRALSRTWPSKSPSAAPHVLFSLSRLALPATVLDPRSPRCLSVTCGLCHHSCSTAAAAAAAAAITAATSSPPLLPAASSGSRTGMAGSTPPRRSRASFGSSCGRSAGSSFCSASLPICCKRSTLRTHVDERFAHASTGHAGVTTSGCNGKQSTPSLA